MSPEAEDEVRRGGGGPLGRMGRWGQSRSSQEKDERGLWSLCPEISFTSMFPPLFLTFLKDYQPAIAQGSPQKNCFRL